MVRRGTLRRIVTTLLALLMMTPQGLLRPCCCLTKAVSAIQSADANPESTPALPPCCRKRLEAAANAAIAERSRTQRAGLHDSGRCGCRPATTMARAARPVFKPLFDGSVVERVGVPHDDLSKSLSISSRINSVAESPPPGSAVTNCVRLCRWVV